MATYTSAQAGNWNTDATWTEEGHPVANDDIVIITHAVDYDAGDSAITWGNITLNSGGILAFPTVSNSTLLFNATGKLQINNGGKLSAGNSTTPIGSAYHCYFHWTQGTSVHEAMELANGGEIEIYGDPAFYSNTCNLTLDSEWDAGLGDTLYVVGDKTATWPVGMKFYLNRGYALGTWASSSPHQSDADIFEIASIGSYDAGLDRTPITVATGHGSTLTCLMAQQLLCLSRNVEMGDPATPWEVYGWASYAENLQFDNNQAQGTELISINHTSVFGWDRVSQGGNSYSGTGLIFVSNKYVVAEGRFCDITGAIISCYIGFYLALYNSFTGGIYSCYKGLRSSTANLMDGDIVSSAAGVECDECVLTGNIVSCGNGLNGCCNTLNGDMTNCRYGLYSANNCSVQGSVISNDRGVYGGANNLVSGEFTNNSADILNIVSLSAKRSCVFENAVVVGNLRPLRIYSNAGTILPLIFGEPNFQAPDSGCEWILECTPNSYCSATPIGQIELNTRHNTGSNLAVYAEATDTTITVKIWPTGWTTALDSDDIVLEATYLNTATGASRTTVTNATATHTNGAWRDVSATISPEQDGVVYFNLYVKKYESGCTLLIDPIASVN